MEALFLFIASCDYFFMRSGHDWIIGIDEVGRGALAGPVTVAAAMIPRSAVFNDKTLGALKDSKKLSSAKREAWTAYFKNHPNVRFAVARIYPRGIERLNISGAANLSALRAFQKITKNKELRLKTAVFLDGGLFLGSRAQQPSSAKTVIKGDEKISAVAIASIFAKVHRDRYMKRLSKIHPEYGFEIHKGYGTKTHRAAIKKYGPCPAHRLTFSGTNDRI